MSGRVFVDTNVLVYAHDVSTGVKHEKARSLVERLWQERTGAVSTQVLQELYVSLRRTAGRPLASEEARISFWDALVIQSSRACGAEILYSGDLSDGQVYDSVRVVSPFGSKTA